MSDPDSFSQDLEATAPPSPPPVAPQPIDVVTFIDPVPVSLENVPAALPVGATSDSTARPGPGLPEAAGWTVMLLSAQIVASILLIVVYFAYVFVASGGRMPPNPINPADLSANAYTLVTGLPGFLGYLVLIPLACWRISPTPLRKLNFSKPSLTQALIVCSCVIPLGFVSDALYSVALEWWEAFLDRVPALGFLKDMGLEEAMAGLNGASLPLLLFFLSVVPAVGEEWMLRGLIGRGLIARWGLVWGILLTSILFAVMHIDPPHVAAVFPIGIMMHIVYLTTRSFWMPILYHFLNNATVSVFTSLVAQESIEQEEQEISWFLIAAPFILTLAATCLWKLRTRYVTAVGGDASRGYFSFEHYPETEARRVAPNHPVVAIVFGLLLALQLVGVGWDVWTLRQEQSSPESELEMQPVAVAALMTNH